MSPTQSSTNYQRVVFSAVVTAPTFRRIVFALSAAVALVSLSSCSVLRTRLPIAHTASCLQEIQPFLDSLISETMLPVVEVEIGGSKTPADYLQLFAEVVETTDTPNDLSASGEPTSQRQNRNLRLVGISPLLGRDFITNVTLGGNEGIEDRISVLAASRFLTYDHLKEITLLYLLTQQRSRLGVSKLCRSDCGQLSLELLCNATLETIRLEFTDSRLSTGYSLKMERP